MNVTVEHLGPCKKLLRIEVEATAVDAAMEGVTREYVKMASLPGFRPGKAPKDMVRKRYDKDILDETKRKLINDNFHQAIKDQKLEVVGYPDIEEIQFGRGQALQFAATVETAPEFDLPEYRGLPANRETTSVTEADVDRAVELLRSRMATYEKVTRPLQTGDVAVVDFSATVEGKPLKEVAPESPGLHEQKAFWVDLGKEQFLPGFGEQLIGAAVGDKREVNVDFPADSAVKELAGKRAVYTVEVKENQSRNLPAVDDAFARQYGAEDLVKLRAGVRADLENELNFRKQRDVRQQVVQALLDRVKCELPESVVSSETRNVVYDLVRENAKRGVSKEVMDQQKEQIYSFANASAKDRVKANFVLKKIAVKENLKVTQEELSRRIYSLSAQYQMDINKFIKDVEKRGALPEIHEQLLTEKAIEFLVTNAAIVDVAPKEPAPAAA